MTIAVEAVYEDGVLKLDRPLDLAEKTRVHVVIESEAASARTPLGSTLNQLREQILATGVSKLDWDDLSAEVAARRGGFKDPR